MLVKRLLTNGSSSRLLLKKSTNAITSSVFASFSRSFSTPISLTADDDSMMGSLDFDSVLLSRKKRAILAATTTIPVPKDSPYLDDLGRVYATGKRKRSIARVWIKEGSGELIVNNKSFVDYFQSPQRAHTLEPFNASRTAAMFDVWCTVKGGGMSGTHTIYLIFSFL